METVNILHSLMPSTYARHLAQVFDDHGRLTADTPLPAETLTDHEEPIEVRHALTVVRNAMAMSNSPDWYMAWAHGMAEHYHGPITMAAVNAPTLGDGLDAFLKFMPVRVPYLGWQGLHDGGEFHCRVDELIEFGPVRHVVVEIPLIVLREYVGRLHPRPDEGMHVALSYPPTIHHRRYRKWFDCEVNFNASHNALIIPARWRDIKNPGFDEANWNAALRRCEQTAPKPNEARTIERVRQQIYAFIDSHGAVAPPSLELVAREMHVSARTLIRKLGSAGTRYQTIVDNIQKDRASTLLRAGNMPIYEIAAELGFKDPASFGRSFKRWFGIPPGAYRARFDGKTD